MSDDLNQDQEVETTNPDDGSESADSEFEALFAEEASKPEESPAPQTETVSRKEFDDLKKGVAKFFSEKGRETKSEAPAAAPSTHAVIKSLYFNAKPEAKEVWEEVEATAKMLGKDPFDVYEGSAYFQGEAKLRTEARKTEEENKAKISKPSSGTGSKPVDVSAVKAEDVSKLQPSQKIEWLKKQAEKERNRMD